MISSPAIVYGFIYGCRHRTRTFEKCSEDIKRFISTICIRWSKFGGALN